MDDYLLSIASEELKSANSALLVEGPEMEKPTDPDYLHLEETGPHIRRSARIAAKRGSSPYTIEPKPKPKPVLNIQGESAKKSGRDERSRAPEAIMY